MQLPIRIELHRSRLLALLVISVHLAALLSIFLLPWAWWPERLALLALLVFSACVAKWRETHVKALLLGEQGDLYCTLAGGESVISKLLPESVVFEHLVVLRLQLGESRRTSSLTLLCDSMPEGQFRCLCVWLRWRANLKDDGVIGRV